MKRLAALSGFGSRAEEALITNYSTLTPEQIFQFTISILQKPSTYRETIDEKFLTKTFGPLAFFQSVTQEHGPEGVKNCCKHIGYEMFPPNACVFKQDSYGDKFYIIIRGKVEVKIDEFHKNKLITNTVQELGAGSSFGELSLITKLPRNATIVCKEECHFAVLTKEHYDLILADSTKRKVSAKAQDLSTFYIFRDTEKHFLLTLIYHFDCEEVGLNRVLYKEAEPAKDIYFIMSGKVKLLTTLHILTEDGFEVPKEKPTTRTHKKIGNRAAEIAIFGKGEILGLEDMMAERPRTTSAICVEPGTIYKISSVEFKKRVLGALTDSYLKDCKGYVRNREQWFETRVAKIQEQMKKNPEFFISLPQQARKDQSPTPSGIKRTNTFETENYDPKSPIEMPRTLSVTMIETVPQGSPSHSDKAAAGFYLTSLMDEDIANTKGVKDSVLDMLISTESPRTKRNTERKRKNYGSPNRQGSINESILSKYTSGKALDNSSERIKSSHELTPERVDARKKRQMKKLFECGIFEKNADEASFEYGLQQRRDLNYSLLLPEIRHASTSPVHHQREREKEKSQKEVYEKQRAIPNAINYFAEKERLLEKLEKKSCRTWDLQNHLAKMMKEKSEFNKKANDFKRNNVAMERRPPRIIPRITCRKQSLPLITETEKIAEHPCVVVHVPKKNSSVREENKGVRLIERSHHIQSPTFEDDYRGPAQKGFVSNISEFQEKINGWKGPYTMLNKRLKRKFVRSQFESLHIGVEYT